MSLLLLLFVHFYSAAVRIVGGPMDMPIGDIGIALSEAKCGTQEISARIIYDHVQIGFDRVQTLIAQDSAQLNLHTYKLGHGEQLPLEGPYYHHVIHAPSRKFTSSGVMQINYVVFTSDGRLVNVVYLIRDIVRSQTQRRGCDLGFGENSSERAESSSERVLL